MAKPAATEGTVEEQFVRPMHLGATIVAYRAREPELAIVPWVDGELLDGLHERIDEFPGLAAWWREAERVWERNKSASSRLSLCDRVDYQRLLRGQLPPPRVVYTKSGQHLAACRVDDSAAVIDHTLYWAPAETVEEARRRFEPGRSRRWRRAMLQRLGRPTSLPSPVARGERMRTMMKIKMDTEAGSRAIADGSMSQLMQQTLGALHPEAAYFGPEGGVRTAFVVFDLQDPSQLPSLSEPLFSKLKATVEMFPVMNQEDLQKGLQQLAGDA